MSDGPLDYLTVLEAKAPFAGKTVVHVPGGEPKVKPPSLKRFRFNQWPVSSFDEMAAALKALHNHRHRCLVVRGKPAPGINLKDSPRRARARAGEPATLLPQARYSLPIDVDSMPCPDSIDPIDEPDALVEHVVERLPEAFHGCSAFWNFTASQGVKSGVRLRLWFWLDRPLDEGEITTWFAPLIAEKLIDPAIYRPNQEIITAAPRFVDMHDTVPPDRRCGIWRGDSDTVEVPAIEKPQPRAANSASSTSGTSLGTGAGYEGYRAQIGDDPGQAGFFRPIKHAVAAFIGKAGAAADTAWLRADLEQAIRAAPRDRETHPDSYVEIRVADLEPLIAAIMEMERVKALAAAEPVEPTYPAPLGSVDDARDVLREAMTRFADIAIAWQPPAEDEPDAPPPPVHAVNADIGAGKTRAWREHAVPRLIAAGKRPVLAVPRHNLGDEIVQDFVPDGIAAHVYRGREADDPDAPGEKMCRDLPRVKEIEGAGGDASKQACKSKAGICKYFYVCGYQKQKQQTPEVWIVPHNLLFLRRPAFIQHDAMAIDESFYNAGLVGIDKEYEVDADALKGDRTISDYIPLTADLEAISARVHNVLKAHPDGRLSRKSFEKAYITAGDATTALSLELRRKLELQVYPGMPAIEYKAACNKVATHNKIVFKLARFWRLLRQTLGAPDELSPWLELRRKTDENGTTRIMVGMIWREDIRKSWHVPTMVLDATMRPEIVRQFFPQMEDPVSATAAMPHTRVRQITDRPMSSAMLVTTETASERRNKSRENNVERLRRLIEVRAADVRPGEAFIACQEAVEGALKKGSLPENVEVAHFNNVTGVNRWSGAGLAMVIGRTEPSPRAVERLARALFGCTVDEVPADERGNVPWPKVVRGVRMRDGTGRRVEGSQHPDPRVEALRWSICEGNLLQTIGRVRGVNRTPDNPAQIDILTNIALPIEVDAVTTWDAIQPQLAAVMRARGAVPLAYRDMAAGHPDLFDSPDGARMALTRENPEQTSIERFLIDVCSGFLSAAYRRTGSRGPAARLLYDPARIDPAGWLRERIGDVTILGEPEPVEPAIPAPAPFQPPVRYCDKIVDTTGDKIERCGEAIHDGRDYCEVHRAQYGRTISGPVDARDWLPPIDGAAIPPAAGCEDWAVWVAAAASGRVNNPTGGLVPLGQVSAEDAGLCVGLGVLTPARLRSQRFARWLAADVLMAAK